MSLVVKNISKIYETNKNKFYALNNVSFSFPEKGIIGISGPSGCGKSTLINILVGIDEPSNGEVIYKGNNINRLSNKDKNVYRNEITSIVFQSYNLLENESAFLNVTLPLKISGKSKKECQKRVNELFDFVNLNKLNLERKAFTFSGGEKQRISIARALANNPKILFADEPTGALDKTNSIIIMELLKKISIDKLVVLVSHDLKLLKHYCDTVIYLKDGKITNPKIINATEINNEKIIRKTKKNNSWIKEIVSSNLKKRRGRNIISALSLGFSLLFTFLIVGFSIGAKESSLKQAENQFDYGTMSLSYELSSTSNNAGINLIKKIRPTKEQIASLKEDYPDLNFEYDFSYLIPQVIDVSTSEMEIENVIFSSIYSFKGKYVDNTLITMGDFPNSDSCNEVVINDLFYKSLKEKTNEEPLNSFLQIDIKTVVDNVYIFNSSIKDTFYFNEVVKIVGVVKDFSFLNTPKIYYSHLAFKNYLSHTYLMSEQSISFLELLENCDDNSILSNYGVKTFLKDINNKEIIKECVSESKNFVFYSDPYTKEIAFLELIDASTIGLSLFLIITIVGTALIVGIVSFSSYSDDKKEIAILYVLGAEKSKILDLYLYENLFLSCFALLFSLICSPFLSLIGNYILSNIIHIDNLITPIVFEFFNVGLLPTILISISTILITFLATYLPIKFASGINLKEELKDD